MVPLLEVIAASTGRSAASKKVQEEYCKMVDELGTEFDILRTIPIEEIRIHSGHLISEGIRRLRGRPGKTSFGLLTENMVSSGFLNRMKLQIRTDR